MMHPNTFVAQVSPAYYTHFLKTVMDAVNYPGPAVIIAYCACPVEHGIGDNMSFDRAQAAVLSRTFPLYVYDPRKGPSIQERLDLKGNPSVGEDWHKDPKRSEVYDFCWFARKEGRFEKHFNEKGEPSPLIKSSQEDRLNNWHFLQELSGLKK